MSNAEAPWPPPPAMILELTRSDWQRTNNPYYVWSAIEICAEHKHELPRWVLDYLAATARRMMSRETAQATDLREILPRLLGFPARSAAPGQYPLRNSVQENAIKYEPAAQAFAAAIKNGAKPSAAIREAAVVIDKTSADLIDDKTLLIHIKQYYGIKKSPSSNIGWNLAIQRAYARYIAGLVELADATRRRE